MESEGHMQPGERGPYATNERTNTNINEPIYIFTFQDDMESEGHVQQMKEPIHI